jgi:hypothetical protein
MAGSSLDPGDRRVAQHQAVSLRPGADQHHRRLPLGRVVRAAQRRAVDGNHGPRGQLHHRHHPGAKPTLELVRIERREDPTAGVVGGNAVRERQNRAHPRCVRPPEGLHFDPGVHPTHDGTERDRHDVEELVARGRADPGASNSRKWVTMRAVGGVGIGLLRRSAAIEHAAHNPHPLPSGQDPSHMRLPCATFVQGFVKRRVN